MRVAFNIASLYAAWFAAVLSAASDRPVLAAIASLVVVVINTAISRDAVAELRLILLAALIGLAFDGALINLGIARYASPGPIAALPPLWLIAMWMAFATSLNVSLAWLKDRLALAALLGAIGGPLSYYGGARLGGMQFGEPIWLSISILAILWAAAFPLLLYLSRYCRSTS